MAAYNTTESVVKKFLNNGFPYFAFYVNNQKLASNETTGDIEEASEKLRDELLTFEHNDTSSWDDKIIIYTFANAMTLQKVGKTDIGHKCSAALTVRFPDKRQNNNYKSDSNFQILQILNEMQNDMKIQREKIASLEAELNDDDDDDYIDENPIMGALRQNPEIVNNFVNSAAMALGGLFNQKNKPVSSLGSIRPSSLGDIDEETKDEEKLYKSLEILKQSDENLSDHLEILAKMSVDNPSQFKWLISMLK
jgi:hypothetical protein